MVFRPRCVARRSDGQSCRMARLAGSQYCWAHDPANAEAAAEARNVGGLRRRREGTVAGAYEFEGLTTTEDIRRLLDVAAVDTLALDNSIARSRTLVAVALAATKLLEVGELEERVEQLETAVKAHRDQHSVYDDRDELGDRFEVEGE
jgi:hypothetical protein